ncbi:MAG: hypothetical protein ACRDDY_10310 [Clostridium sp.]|uniref:hypothetical protein n=1 Tax=Clostridium sp. TaxID=1506 RepID=UPI003EE81E03
MCVFCLYGITFDDKAENRIQRLARTHPELYNYCTRGGKHDEEGRWIPYQGLGLAHVMDELGVEWRVEEKGN